MLSQWLLALLVGGVAAGPCAPGWGDHGAFPGGHAGVTKTVTNTVTATVDPTGHTTTNDPTNPSSSGESRSLTSSTTANIPSPSSIIQYSAVTGYFLQDDNATVPDGFDYSLVNFGLINQTYDTDTDSSSTQWERFAAKLEDLQSSAPDHISYKLVFMGRHGEGNHNAMVSTAETEAPT